MGIPRIRAYPMPTAPELPPAVPRWRPDPERAALLIHDMQRYFVDRYPAAASPVVELLANIGRIRRVARDLRIPVVYTVQPGRLSPRERGLVADFWGPGMAGDEHDRDIVAPLRPGPADTVVARSRYSAFHRSPLAGVLRAHGRDQLLVCGVYAHVGCLMTAADAFSRDIEPFLVADAVADFTAADHRMALAYAARTCAVALTTAQLLATLATGSVGQPPVDQPGQLYP
ncbi:MAG: isochorismatase family protein [Actinobacteria bacterium]|nr:MAG: isochorismatase family protein [Actinomycetota bacterium]